MRISDEAFEMLFNWDVNKNKIAPILFRDFSYRSSIMNKSYLVKREDIQAASLIQKSNSISCLNSIKLRWDFCLPVDGDWDINKAKIPLREFVKSLGLELYLDMDEVVDLRSFRYLRL